MDLADGQSFAMAGLIDNRVTNILDKVPGLGDIPILGKLFQSWSKQKSTDELLVVVTPHIVQPLTAANTPKGPVFPVPFLPPVPAEQPKTPDEVKRAGKLVLELSPEREQVISQC